MVISFLRAAAHDVPASAGAVVMGTGIVSVGLRLDGHGTFANVLLCVAAATGGLLALLAAWRAWSDRNGFLAGARSPAALTAVAASAVLGSGAKQLGWTAVTAVLLVVALAGWAGLTAVAKRVEQKSGGVVFMLVVAPQSIATLTAELAELARARWLLVPAGAFAALGLALYPVVLRRFDIRALRHGGGAHWVAGGSLAVSALAVARLADGTQILAHAALLHDGLRIAALVIWALALAWFVALVASELRWPRQRYRGERWSTVFPLGMYAVCSFAVSTAGGPHAGGDFARVWIWLAVAGWGATALGTLDMIRRRIHFVLSGSSEGRGLPSTQD